MSNDRRDRIPSEELTAYERWELPLLDGDGNEVANSRAEQRNVKPLTAGDIEAIREAAWQDGLTEGKEAGHREGYEAGLEAGRRDGFEKGHGEGTEKGRVEAMDATRADVNQGLERLEQMMAELLDPIHRHEDELETALFNLTATLARAVIFRELRVDSSQIRDVVLHAMASLPSTRDNVRIRVHPDDVDHIRDVAGRFEAEAIVTADDSILPGGCKVETRHSLVDYTVEKRFQKAVQGMLDQQLDSDEPGDSADLDALMGDLTDFHRDVLEADAGPDAESGQESPPDDIPPDDTAPDDTAPDDTAPDKPPSPSSTTDSDQADEGDHDEQAR
jgi:flagellar assembly protein FliH